MPTSRVRVIACGLLVAVLLVFGVRPLQPATVRAEAAATGLTADYTVTVTAPPDAAVRVKATFTGAQAPLRLVVGYPRSPAHSLELFKDLRFSSADGKALTFATIDRRTVEVTPSGGTVVATFRFSVPAPWTVVSAYPRTGEAFVEVAP